MEESEYESLPTEKVTVHLAAGALAGVLEHCVMYPVDCVKVRSSNSVVLLSLFKWLAQNIYPTGVSGTNFTHFSCHWDEFLYFGLFANSSVAHEIRY